MYQWMQDNLRPGEDQQQEKPEAAEPEPLDLSWLDPESPSFDPNAMAQQLSGLVESAVEQRVQQAISACAGGTAADAARAGGGSLDRRVPGAR
jgi:hypothetical protein